MKRAVNTVLQIWLQYYHSECEYQTIAFNVHFSLVIYFIGHEKAHVSEKNFFFFFFLLASISTHMSDRKTKSLSQVYRHQSISNGILVMTYSFANKTLLRLRDVFVSFQFFHNLRFIRQTTDRRFQSKCKHKMYIFARFIFYFIFFFVNFCSLFYLKHIGRCRGFCCPHGMCTFQVVSSGKKICSANRLKNQI